MNSPLSGDFQSWQREQPTEWGPLRKEDGGCRDQDDSKNKFRFTTGVYSNVWENRAASLNSEVIVDASAAYAPPLPVNPENPQAWFSVSAQGRSLGVVKLELMADRCPLAAENFFRLCETGVYRGSFMHRIVPGCAVQGGDYHVRCDTTVPQEDLFDLSLVQYRLGGRSIYEEITFADEDRSLKHAGPGVLSMASESPGVNASQFFVTLGDDPQPHLDKRYQAFGQVLSGMEVLRAVEILGTPEGKPLQRVVMDDCGIGAGPGSSPDSTGAVASSSSSSSTRAEAQAAQPRATALCSLGRVASPRAGVQREFGQQQRASRSLMPSPGSRCSRPVASAALIRTRRSASAAVALTRASSAARARVLV